MHEPFECVHSRALVEMIYMLYNFTAAFKKGKKTFSDEKKGL